MRNLRKILWPFACLYGGIVWLRNKFFDWRWLTSKSYDFPVLSVGNLSVGGTGKTPMIEYLIRLLKTDYRLATLSRGYKRETAGFRLLTGKETAREVGDEPLQFKVKFPNIRVAVEADRQNGIARLRRLTPPPEVILLDDAFQHRKVNPSYSILLTSYDRIYADDLMLPAGNLREPVSGARRAQTVVVTKCPPQLSLEEQNRLKTKLNLRSNQKLFFSYIGYAETVTNGQQKMPLTALNDFCLVTGIAKPQPLVDYLTAKEFRFVHRKFPDHHHFSQREIADLAKQELILTTEKDFMRLQHKIPLNKLFYIPIKQQFINDKKAFDQLILEAVAAC